MVVRQEGEDIETLISRWKKEMIGVDVSPREHFTRIEKRKIKDIAALKLKKQHASRRLQRLRNKV